MPGAGRLAAAALCDLLPRLARCGALAAVYGMRPNAQPESTRCGRLWSTRRVALSSVDGVVLEICVGLVKSGTTFTDATARQTKITRDVEVASQMSDDVGAAFRDRR